jgi:hypothetical protein
MSDYEEAASVIERALAAEVVVAGVMRVRPETDDVIALNVMEALSAAGFEVVRRQTDG